MKAPQIIAMLLAFILGAGLIAALKNDGSSADLENEVASLKKQLDELGSKPEKVSAVPKAAPRPAPVADQTPQPSSALSALIDQAGKGDNGEELSAEERMAKLFDSPEARNLMKGFAGAMSGRAGKMIAGEVTKYQEKLGLNEAQVDSITRRMTTMVEANTKKFQSQLDDGSRPMQEIMEEQGQFWQNNEAEIEGMLKEELNDEQFDQFQTEQLVERTQRVQRSADRELASMDEKLELDESQEDQVFAILVQQSPEFDPAMGIEGVGSTLPPAATGADVSKDDAIRSVLNPDQVDTYNSTVESGGFNPRRRGPWGRGGF
jgi:hypothetical protein